MFHVKKSAKSAQSAFEFWVCTVEKSLLDQKQLSSICSKNAPAAGDGGEDAAWSIFRIEFKVVTTELF